jgi:hypothetical protein
MTAAHAPLELPRRQSTPPQTITPVIDANWRSIVSALATFASAIASSTPIATRNNPQTRPKISTSLSPACGRISAW